MQVLGVFGFEVLDEGLFSLPTELGRASIRFPLETLLALLLVLFRVFVHASGRTLDSANTLKRYQGASGTP